MKVMVVDDEPIIRLGLRTLIDWENSGFTLVGEAADGEEALLFMSEQQVDLLVTDIRMPRMDGLDLIREARRRTDDIGIVVLSCLDDFSYVKEAMKLGAFDYILKPTMEPDELLRILRVISEKLEEERQAKARLRELNERLEQSKLYQLQADILHYLEHGKNEDQLRQALFRDRQTVYSMLVCTPSGMNALIREAEKHSVSVVVRLQDQRYLLLLECDRSLSANDWYQLAYTTSHNMMRGWGEAEFDHAAMRSVLLVGPPLVDVCDLRKRIDYHYQQLVDRFYGRSADTVYLDNPKLDAASDAPLPGAIRNDLLRAIAGHNPDAMLHSLQQLLAEIGRIKPDLTRLHPFLFESVGLAIGYARDNGYYGLQELEQQYLSVEAISNMYEFEEVKAWLTRFINELADSRDGAKIKREVLHPFVRKAIAYIRDNYAANIGTTDIAAHVKLSRSYLSDLYGKEVGESLTETLTRVRIEEACKLLSTTDKKIYEIAEETGFNDSKTFTKTFKRLMGCSPKEYPASNK